MANKKYELQFDFNTKDVEIASDRVLNLKEQLRILQKELNTGNLSQEQFEILSSKLGETEDRMKQTRARSADLITTLQLIPGPVGEIASKFNGTIALLKQFSGFKLKDLQFQMKETIDDVKEIGNFLGKATGITKIYTTLNNALASSFVKVGIGEQAAAVGARAFSAALVATGVGALVVLLGTAVSALMDFASGTDEAEQQQKQFNDELERTNMLLDMDLASAKRRQAERIAELKKNGATEKDIREQGVKDLKENLQLTTTALDEAYKQENAAMGKGVEALEKAQKNTLNLETKQKDLISQIRIAGLDNQTAANNEAKALREKNIANAKQAGEKEKQLQQEILKSRKESYDSRIELEVSSENTSREKLVELYEKRNALELNDLKNADSKAKELLKNKKITDEQYLQIIAGTEAKRQLLAKKTTDSINTAVEDDKKKSEELVKTTEDFNKKVRDLRTGAILDDVARDKQARTDKYNDDLTALESDKEFVKRSETEKAEIRANLKQIYNNDINKIDKTQADKEKENAMKAFDERLRILELQGQSLLAGTRAYFDNRKAILAETESKELAQLKMDLDSKKLTQEQYEAALTATTAKYADARKKLKEDELAAIGKTISATFDALGGLTTALAGSYDEEAKTSEAAFNKRKKLQIATAAMSAASGLVQILTQPSTLPSPFDWIVKGINAAALGIATAVNISKIKKTTFEAPDSGGGGGSSSQPYSVTANRASGGIVTGAGTSTSDSINARLSNGEYVVNARATSSYLPLLNAINDAGLQPRFASGGLFTGNEGTGTAQAITSAIQQGMMERPVKTYVVGQDMSNQQQFDRTIKSRSLL